MPAFMLKAWYFLRIYIFNDCAPICSYSDDGVLMGFVLFNLNRNEIVFISVNPQYQRFGVGTELLQRIKVDTLIVKYSASNHKVKSFYAKNGFKELFDDGLGHTYAKRNIWSVNA
jgi:GNAT superfamily N-acetyltransferase